MGWFNYLEYYLGWFWSMVLSTEQAQGLVCIDLIDPDTRGTAYYILTNTQEEIK